jgi:hypothetical protein
MGAVARFGQLPELYMMATFFIGAMNPKMAMGDVGLAIPMVIKGKMQFIPRRAKGADEVSRIYKKTMEKARAREKAEAKATASAAKAAAKASKAAAAAFAGTAASAAGWGATAHGSGAGAEPGSEVAE